MRVFFGISPRPSQADFRFPVLVFGYKSHYLYTYIYLSLSSGYSINKEVSNSSGAVFYGSRVVVQNTLVYSYIKRVEKITLRRFRKSNCFLKEQTDKKAFETKTKKKQTQNDDFCEKEISRQNEQKKSLVG